MARHIHVPIPLWLLLLVIGSVLTGCRASPEKQEAKFLQRGDALLQRKEYSRAVLQYRNASQVRPKDAEPYYRLGLAYEQMSNPQAAVSAYRQTLQENSKHAGAQLKLAELMATYGNQQVVAEAEQRLQGLIQTPSENSQVLDTLAIAEFRLGKADEAARLLEQARGKYPAEIEPAVLLAQLKLRQNNFAAAEQVLKDAVRTAPKSPAAALALGRLYLGTNHPEQAEPELRRALALDSEFAPALLSLALLETNRNRSDQAEQIYRRLSTNSDKDYRRLYGSFLLQHGKTEAALNELQRLASQDRDDRAARTRLVAAYLAAHRTAEAQKLLSGVLNKNAKDTDALMQRAGLYLQSGDFANAEQDLDRVVHDRPDSAEAHLELAVAKRMQGLLASERQELLLASLHDPGYLPARLALARNYIAANEDKSALDLLDSAPREQKNLRELRIQRIWALLGLGDRQTARPEIEQLLAASRSPDALEQDGFLKMTDRNFAGARQGAEEILSQTPENMRALRLLMDSYAGANQRAAGIQRLREIAAHQPKSAQLQYAFGQILLASGDRDNARRAFEAALAADSKFAAAQLALGQIDFLENRLDSARSRVAAVLAAQPRNVTALSAAGDIELRAGNDVTALEKYRAVVNIDSSNVLALIASASLLVRGQDLDEAWKLAERAVELAPANPRAQEISGWVQYSKGNYAAAAEYLKSALQLGPTPSRQYHLALSYLRGGQGSLGKSALVTALQQDPDLPQKDRGW